MRFRFWLLSFFIFLLLAMAAAAVFFYRQERSDWQSASRGYPLHDCAIGRFTQAAQAGEPVVFDVRLSPSRFWRSYELELGSLPAGIQGDISGYSGRTGNYAYVEIDIDPEVPPISYSLVITYRERGLGFTSDNHCQFNLLIE